jgi:hypothetical protein
MLAKNSTIARNTRLAVNGFRTRRANQCCVHGALNYISRSQQLVCCPCGRQLNAATFTARLRRSLRGRIWV